MVVLAGFVRSIRQVEGFFASNRNLLACFVAMYAAFIVWLWQSTTGSNYNNEEWEVYSDGQTRYPKKTPKRRTGANGAGTSWTSGILWPVQRLIQVYGLHGFLALLVVFGSMYQYRHQVGAILDYMGLSFLTDTLGFSGQDSLSSLDGEEEDLSDLPELIDAPEVAALENNAMKTKSRSQGLENGKSETIRIKGATKPTPVPPSANENSNKKKNRKNKKQTKAPNVVDENKVMANFSSNLGNGTRRRSINLEMEDYEPAMNVSESRLHPVEQSPPFIPPQGWKVYDRDLGLVTIETQRKYQEAQKLNRDKLAKNDLPPIRNFSDKRRSSSTSSKPHFVISHFE